MDPRLPYALGALAGLAHADAAHSDTLEASNGPGCEVATSAMAVALHLLRAPGEDCATHSGTQLPTTASADARLMCAIPVGIALSTVDLEAFAETVWRVCGGVGVVVDCLIARVDDDVRPALWGRAGLAFCFLWGVGLFFWACCWAVCIFLWRV